MPSPNWPQVLMLLCPELGPTIERGKKHGPCVTHGGKDGLRCFDDFDRTGGMICNRCGAFPNGYLVIAWRRNISPSEARALVRNLTPQFEPPKNVVSINEGPDKNMLKQYQQILSETLHLNSEAAEVGRRYLWKRGIDLDAFPECIRFHQSLPYFENSTVLACCPALVCPVVKDDQFVSLHRTYLTPEGEKVSGTSKKLMKAVYPGATKGAAIRLYDCQGELCIAEGIETALAVRMATGMPVWSAISAPMMPYVQIPHHVKFIDIWADHDVNQVGQEAARKLKSRLLNEGKHCRVLVPESSGVQSVDWLDVLVGGQ